MGKTLRTTIPIILACLVLGMIYYLAGSSRAAASSLSAIDNAIFVTTLEDEMNNDGDCSLREAIAAANTNTAVDTCPAGNAVLVDSITFNGAGTITLTSQLLVANSGPEAIFGNDAITLNGGGSTRIIEVQSGADLFLDHLNLINGNYFTGSGIYNGGTLRIEHSTFEGNSPGAIKNEYGNLYISDSTFSNNYSDGEGGAIEIRDGTVIITGTNFIDNGSFAAGGAIWNSYESGFLKITNSTFTGNHSDQGGAIDNHWGTTIIVNSIFSGNEGWDGAGAVYDYEGTVVITGSTFTGNDNHHMDGGTFNNWGGSFTISNCTVTGSAAPNGGAINNGTTLFEGSTMTITGSTIAGNRANSAGGGIQNLQGMMTVINSTISDNNASAGGAIKNDFSGVLYINFSTIAQNTASIGGGINTESGMVTVRNSIIANNFLGNDCYGVILDGGHNLSSDNSCSLDPSNGSMPNTNPLLGTLQDHGGPTKTIGLLWHSPAIDAGDEDQCPPTDQRGVLRPQDGDGDGLAVCDIGSFELIPPVYLHYVPVVQHGW